MPTRRERPPECRRWDTRDPLGFAALAEQFLEHIQARNFSTLTVNSRARNLRFFFDWAQERGLMRPPQITLPILERYQRYLHHAHMKNGRPLSVRTQWLRLQTIRSFYRWLARGHYILSNPAADLELPRLAKTLPRDVLTMTEVQQVMNLPDVGTPLGLRDRAILETLYSTGMRRAELLSLHRHDLNFETGVVCIRCGKGKKDRMVPIGERAAAWVRKYLDDARPALMVEPDDGTVFLAYNGTPLADGSLGGLVRNLIRTSGVGKTGSCHLFRHTMATHMLEGGADIRFIQQMLGHAQLTTTEIYTQVTIRKLREVFMATHPSAHMERRE